METPTAFSSVHIRFQCNYDYGMIKDGILQGFLYGLGFYIEFSFISSDGFSTINGIINLFGRFWSENILAFIYQD